MRRNTIQRQLTLDTVKALKDHPTAEEVYENIRSKYPDISKGTVYRNLNALVDTGDISKISLPNQADRFDHIPEKHYHVRCVKCGRLTDIEAAYMKDIDERIAALFTDFQLEGHEIFFNGKCRDCNN